MKRTLFIVALILATSPLAVSQVIVNPPKTSGTASATSAAAMSEKSATASKSSPIQGFIDLERAFDTAYRSRDTAAIDRMLTNDFISTDPTGRVWTKAELLKEIGDSKGETVATVVNDITQVNPYGGTSAVVAGLITVKSSSGSTESQFRYTNTFVKKVGKWLIAASQQTRTQP